MTGRQYLSRALLTAVMLASACTSRDDKAAAAAAIAADALQQGQVEVARQQIDRALMMRDDVSDYWLLSAHIALAEQNYGNVFNAYESVALFDHGNIEALTRLCQIALGANQPQRAQRYADQLATLHPGDSVATTVKAALALQQGDKATAARLLDQVLAIDPADVLALIVKTRLLIANEDYVGATKVAEASLTAPGDPGGRLEVLKDAYLKSKDADGYRRTIARLARAYPQVPGAQLDYARSLYDTGDTVGGLAVSQRVLLLRPDDVGIANAVLDLWLAQGAAAMPTATIVTSANGGSLEARATYAQFANVIGRPDLALAVLGDDAAQEPATTANSDAKAARAYARALSGDTDAATAEIAAVLSVDEDQPRALVVRAWLRAKGGDGRGAIGDLRHALTGNADNAAARLALADLQLAESDAVLAAATLRDGLDTDNADPRLARRLVALFRAQGRKDAAAAVIEAYARTNPFSRALGV